MIVLHIPSWFPNVNNPYDGNFIIKHIASTMPYATAIVLRHVEETTPMDVIALPSGVIFHSIRVARKMGKVRLLKAYCKAFEKIIAQYGKPDVIHAHVALPLGMVAATLSQRYKIPLLLTEHWSIYQPENRKKLNFLQQLQLRYVYAHIRHLTAVTSHLHKMIEETVPAASIVPATVVSNVVDTKTFYLKPAGEHEKKRILHISTLDDSVKNISGILHAIEILSKKRQDFCLDIIHELDNPQVEAYIQAHRLEDFVHLLGSKPAAAVADEIRASDFILLFSNNETQSCVLLESFCCGRPVVTTPVGGIPEIANERNAIFVEPRNVSQLVEKLDLMLNNCGDFDAQYIQDDAHARYAYPVIGKQFATIYKSLIHN